MRDQKRLTRSPPFSIYKGIGIGKVTSNTTWYRLILTQYHQIPTIAVLY